MFNEFRVIISGSRDFEDYELLKKSCDYYLKNKLLDPNLSIIILSGGASQGADALGEKYAAEHGLKVEKYPADWNKFGKRAGYLRNNRMAEASNALIAFRSAYSDNRGIDIMIDIARKHHLLVREITEEE